MEEHALRRMTQCKGSETMTWKGLVALVVVMGAMAGAWPGSANAGVQKLYVLDCGQNIGKDQSRWSPGVNEGKAIEFSDNCYLIRHDKGLLLWDTGVPDAVAAKLEGDHDVFGDGSVTIVSTPGHTPGHQSLLVQLPKTGWLLLSGDAVHFQDNWTHKRVPQMNFNRDQTLASLQRIAALLEERKAQLWINHDKQQSARLRYAPAYYE